MGMLKTSIALPDVLLEVLRQRAEQHRKQRGRWSVSDEIRESLLSGIKEEGEERTNPQQSGPHR